MPKGPNGQKRPADVIGAAVMVGKIATGEVEEKRDDENMFRKDAPPKSAPSKKP